MRYTQNKDTRKQQRHKEANVENMTLKDNGGDLEIVNLMSYIYSNFCLGTRKRQKKCDKVPLPK